MNDPLGTNTHGLLGLKKSWSTDVFLKNFKISLQSTFSKVATIFMFPAGGAEVVISSVLSKLESVQALVVLTVLCSFVKPRQLVSVAGPVGELLVEVAKHMFLSLLTMLSADKASIS